MGRTYLGACIITVTILFSGLSMVKEVRAEENDNAPSESQSDRESKPVAEDLDSHDNRDMQPQSNVDSSGNESSGRDDSSHGNDQQISAPAP